MVNYNQAYLESLVKPGSTRLSILVDNSGNSGSTGVYQAHQAFNQTFGARECEQLTLKLRMNSKLDGGIIKAVNTWAVALLRYGGGVIRWTKNELQNIDGMTRKVITITRSCNQEVVPQEYIYQERKGEEDS